MPSPLRNLWWLFAGILTLGLIYPVPAVICWRRAYRFSSPHLTRPPALEWLIWALSFTLLSTGAYIGWGFAIAAGSSDSSSGGSFSYTPPKVTDLAFGSTATFEDEVAPPNETGKARISMTLSDLVHHPRTKVKDVNVTAQVRVCATSTSVDPLMAALSPTISPVGEPAGSSGLLPSPDYTLPDDFYHQLAPHRCVTGTIGYQFPTGATVNAFYLDGNAGDIVVWKLTHAQSGGPV